ncbi:serine/threonine-protein kinase [Mycoplasma sp. Mirounga ES2805-ORL]|uniref:serine/threonine protein kinase n=1 Tax=Mycoplasma sp. Mirounga ES2805-ORL TaxID=754514 RepID=UPI00197BFC57|nr:serine/threonine-protein kinase [Mycoplasma sp. Mirounga ES2805-ORL]QSF13443.1 serine/threonine protein kinase [Mycoplasma sp. Mirounga ES2805-ORL]
MNIKRDSIVFKKYKVIKELGSGGFSVVYKVQPNDPSKQNEFYALKYLTIDKNSNSKPETTLNRFRHEIEVYKKIRSDRIAKYIDSHMSRNEQFIVMEYVEGENMKDRLRKNGRFIPKEAVYFAEQIAEGIQELHSLNIIHRDIKSNNIMITKTRNVKIIDFGLALDEDTQRLTETAKVVGSVYYMAPELCVSNSQPSVQSDIYALGIMLFEMLTGKYPIRGKDPLDTIRKQKTQPIPDIKSIVEIPQSLANIIIKATAKNPDKRYSSMYEMKEDLKTCLSQKRYIEKPLDIRRVSRKKTLASIINSRKFIISSIVILSVLFIALLITVALLV